MFQRIWAKLRRNLVASRDNPIPVERLWMLPDGLYRMRNFEVVSVCGGGDDRQWLCRSSGGSLPSIIPLRWSKRGDYAQRGEHPFDLVEYLGADLPMRTLERPERPYVSIFPRN